MSTVSKETYDRLQAYWLERSRTATKQSQEILEALGLPIDLSHEATLKELAVPEDWPTRLGLTPGPWYRIDANGDFTITQCTTPPEGWYCTRLPGHEGPCAAHPKEA